MKSIKFLLAVSFCLLFATTAGAESYVVVEDTTTIYASPEYESTEIATAYPGIHFEFRDDRNDGWTEVRIHTDNTRYVRAGDVQWTSDYQPPNYKNYELSKICDIKEKIDEIDEIAIERTEEILESRVAEKGYETAEISQQRLRIEDILIDRLTIKNRQQGTFNIDPIGIEKMLLEAMQPLELWNKETCT
jgi:hypothetical protein